MRIKSISLMWFRGASDAVALEPNAKSMVVYGDNGSGKSSFTDAIEYVLRDGKIGHLAHEYSGRKQLRAVLNTHKPDGVDSSLVVTFSDGSSATITISDDGSASRSGSPHADLETWDYRRTVLRQDELSAFIHQTKGGKYSALLPLLGLQELEIAAENLRQLARSIEQESNLQDGTAARDKAEGERETIFENADDAKILEEITSLFGTYYPETPVDDDPIVCCRRIEQKIDEEMTGFTLEQRRYVRAKSIADADLSAIVAEIRDADAELAHQAEPLVAKKLQVLEDMDSYLEGVAEGDTIACPACGTSLTAAAASGHVAAEHTRLLAVRDLYDRRKRAVGRLCDAVRSLQTDFAAADVRDLRVAIEASDLAPNAAALKAERLESLRSVCGSNELARVESMLIPLVAEVDRRCGPEPRDVSKLTGDKRRATAAALIFEVTSQMGAEEQIRELVRSIRALENRVREEIKQQSQAVIDEISAKIRSLWTMLHPSDRIEDVRLYLPDDSDKAIEIGLKFHGVDQDSPRLTLSEGHRNSLGLCIFLAMAMREAEQDRPLILDDVVVSLDRQHRGMIAGVLAEQFSDRQVVILTHDRDWYMELRQQLDSDEWRFGMLLPYESPEIGIRWSESSSDFDVAREHLEERPDSAGNDARKIMDVELARIAERLKIKMPYLRAHRNDMRMAHDFLIRLISDSKQCLQLKGGQGYAIYDEGIAALDAADRLLLSWGNRASHSFDVVRPEAEKLIDASELALKVFRCSECGKPVWFADAGGSEWVQCQCGRLRWRYGKG